MEEPAYIEKLIYGIRRLAFFFELFEKILLKRKNSRDKLFIASTFLKKINDFTGLKSQDSRLYQNVVSAQGL